MEGMRKDFGDAYTGMLLAYALIARMQDSLSLSVSEHRDLIKFNPIKISVKRKIPGKGSKRVRGTVDRVTGVVYKMAMLSWLDQTLLTVSQFNEALKTIDATHRAPPSLLFADIVRDKPDFYVIDPASRFVDKRKKAVLAQMKIVNTLSGSPHGCPTIDKALAV